MELKDKVAIVTGGGRGAGEGIARIMAREGARLAVVDLNLENARRVAHSIDPTGTRAIAIHADVSRKADAEAMVAETIRAFGTVDILVNNAGIEGAPRSAPGSRRGTVEPRDGRERQGRAALDCASAAVADMRTSHT